MPDICGGLSIAVADESWCFAVVGLFIASWVRGSKCLTMATLGPKHVVVVNSSPSMLSNETICCVYDFLHTHFYIVVDTQRGCHILKKLPLPFVQV